MPSPIEEEIVEAPAEAPAEEAQADEAAVPDESPPSAAIELPAFPIAEPDYNSKLVPDFTPFQEALDGFSAERAIEMDGLLRGKTVLDIQEMMDSGQIHAEELVTYYLERIQKYDVDMLNSVMELNPEALQIAAQLEEERAEGNVRGAMHGIPVLLKANIATADHMKTTAGAVALQEWQPQRDAFLVQQLRDAGAIILGKANLSEWANYMDLNNPNGFTALGGKTRDAYGPFDPLGSSTGSAVSVAANLAAVSVGTETQGSIVAPSTVNSVAGLKTSRGLVSRDYIIPLVDWMDTPGPIGRNVTDVAVSLTAMTGTDDNDAATQDAAELAGTDFTQFLSLEEAQKVRALSVPAGYSTDGTPISVLLVGDYLSEPQLISVGYAYEQAAQVRVQPDVEARMQQIAAVVPMTSVPKVQEDPSTAAQEVITGGDAAEDTEPLFANIWTWSAYTDPAEGPLDIQTAGELYTLERTAYRLG